jgi:4-hydroxybenzoate polyprenyltransferase
MLISLAKVPFMESNHTVFPPFIRYSPLPAMELIKKHSMDLVHFLIYSSIFMGMQGVGLVYIASFNQGVECMLVCVVIMFLLGFSIYNLNRKTDEAEDAINHQDRYRFTKKYEKSLYNAAIVGCGFVLILGAWYGLLTFLMVLLPLILGVLYSIPCLPPSTGYRRLKEVPFLKNLIVAIAWGVPLTFIPLFVSNMPVSFATVITLIYLCSFVFIASVLPDIRDMEGDKVAGIRTIPTVIGVERTMILIRGINLMVGTSAIVISALYLSPIVAFVLTVSTVYTHLSINFFVKGGKKDLICDVLTDGQFIFIGTLAYGLTVVAGALAIIG